MQIDETIRASDLKKPLEKLWELSDQKLFAVQKRWKASSGAPVFTVDGLCSARAWTQWTEGFFYGSHLLQYDVCGDEKHLEIARAAACGPMLSHLTHTGVHDHAFNNLSVYGNLLRLLGEEKIAPATEWEKRYYEQAITTSGAVQAARWTDLGNHAGYVYSFNGAHSLFVDTLRTVRIMEAAHSLSARAFGENDAPVPLLERAISHALTTAHFNVYYGEGRDSYDTPGRVAHESLFNVADKRYRAPSTQQGYSPFSTWTRGLAWALLGYAEQLEYVSTLDEKEFLIFGGKAPVLAAFEKAARATAQFFIKHSSLDGVPLWDTGAPNAHKLGDYTQRAADPYNPYEPFDASAAAIAVQGFLRLSHYLRPTDAAAATRYEQAGLVVMRTLLKTPFLSEDPAHEGLLLHSVYHRPNGWDHVPQGQKIMCGESSQWGDYHLREAALMLSRTLNGEPYYRFF